MGRRKTTGRPRSCKDWLTFIDCQYLPHGSFSLIPAVLSTIAFWSAIVQDGCDFVMLQGGNIEKVTGSDVYPFVDAGISHYRTPIYYTSDNQWKKVFTANCQDYPDDSRDIFLEIAKYSSLISLIFAGSLALFLWFTTCLTFSIRTWRFCAVEAILAAIFRSGSFLFLFSSICTGTESSCGLAFGSTMDIIGIVLLIITALVMLGHYPNPKLRELTDEEIVSAVAEVDDLKPKPLVVGTQSNKRGLPPLAGGESTRNLGGPGLSRFGGESKRNLDAQSYYGGDGASVASKSFYNNNEFTGDTRNQDEQSYYGGDGGRSVASQSFYSKGYPADGRSVASQSYFDGGYDDQSVASKSYFNTSQYAGANSHYDDGGRSVASQSYFSVSKDQGAFV